MDNLHEGHRERIRQEFLQHGFDCNTPPHKILELLLFYCVGYATGLFLGSTIESKIALGTSNLQLIANDENTENI